MQMFLVFPLSTPFKVGGVGLGALTPVFVIIFNTIGWGIPAYAWFRLAGEASYPPQSRRSYSKWQSTHQHAGDNPETVLPPAVALDAQLAGSSRVAHALCILQ